MTEITKEDYLSEARNALDHMLEDDFVNRDFFAMNGVELLTYLENRTNTLTSSSRTSNLGNFCVLGTYEGCKDCEYKGRSFVDVSFTFGKRNVSLSKRLFDSRRCKLLPVQNMGVPFAPTCYSGPRHSMLVGDKNYTFDWDKKGSRVLMMYCFPVVDEYKKKRTCYRLLVIEGVDYARIATFVMQSQHFFLYHLLTCTTVYTHHVDRMDAEIQCQLFQELFDREYRPLFEEKVVRTEKLLEKNCVQPLETFEGELEVTPISLF